MAHFRSSAVLLVVLLGGCSAITDFGQFNFDERDDLTVTLENLRTYEDQQIYFLLTRRDDVGLVFVGQLNGVLEGVAEPDDRDWLQIVIPGVIERDTSYDVLVHVDLDQDGTINDAEPLFGSEVDVDGNTTVELTDTPGSFDIPTNELGNGHVELQLTNFSPHIGDDTQQFVLTVVDVEEDKPVAYSRTPDVPGLDFGVYISDCVMPGREYLLEFYADNDGNGEYSGAGNAADHSWYEMRTADDSGVFVTFDHRTPFQEITHTR